MKIKKISEEITYRETHTTHVFDVNGKKVEVYATQHSDDGNDEIISIEGKAILTDIELEALDEEMTENLELKVGEERDIINIYDIPN